MSTNSFTENVPANEAHQYRALCSTAVVSTILGVTSLVTFAVVETPSAVALLLVIPIIGLLLGIAAYAKIRSSPMELTGVPMAMVGIVLSAMTVVAAPTVAGVIYANEVPEGYQRLSFYELQPERESRLPVSQAALDLNGQQVFIKGYVYPDGQKNDIRQFVLVPDMGTCCFGGQPKLTDMVEVTMKGSLRTEFSRRKRKLGGVLKVDTRKKPVSGLDGVYYQLEADFLK